MTPSVYPFWRLISSECSCRSRAIPRACYALSHRRAKWECGFERKQGKGHIVEALQRRLQALVVAGQAPESSGPGETALNHPAARQQYKASFGGGQFDRRQLDAVGLGGCGWRFAGVA